MQALVDGLGPSILFNLFEEYEVPEDDRFGLIEGVLGLLVVYGRPVENLPAWFVETLERRCRMFVAVRDDGEPVPIEASGLALVGRVEYLCHASQEEVFRDPRGAVELAERAVELADRIDPEVCGEGIATEQRILARAWLGNARRVASDLNGSERAFQESLRLLRNLDPMTGVRAEVWNLLGSLRIDQGRFAEARSVLELALREYRSSGALADVGKVLMKLGDVEGYAGNAEEAVVILREAVSTLEAASDERLMILAHRNLTDWMVDAGRAREALVRYNSARTIYEKHFQAPTLRLRLRWLEGRIYSALSDFISARVAFEEVRARAVDLELAYEHAAVSLELALVYLRQGETRLVTQLADEMVLFFQSRGLHRDLFAAIQLFRRAVEAETVTVGLIEETLQFFRCSWISPRPFEPSCGWSPTC